MKVLLASGANVNVQSTNGTTALMLAAHFGQEASARALLEKGADASVTNRKGDTAKTIALHHLHLNVVQVLTDAELAGR